MALPAVPKTTLTRENILTYLGRLAYPPNKVSLQYEVNAVAHQLIEELKRCREVKDTAIVRLANKASRCFQWNQRIHVLELATLLTTCVDLYNAQMIPAGLKEDCAYYAELKRLVSAVLSHRANGLLSRQNEDLLLNTCRYFLLGHNWAGIETEHVRVRYYSPDEGCWSGCWEARLLKWIYPFVRQDLKQTS